MVKEVFINGMAWTTALGCGLLEVWYHLLAADSGLHPVQQTQRLRNSLAAVVANPSFKDSPQSRLHMFAVETISRALADAKCNPSDKAVYLVLGTSLGSWIEDSFY